MTGKHLNPCDLQLVRFAVKWSLLPIRVLGIGSICLATTVFKALMDANSFAKLKLQGFQPYVSCSCLSRALTFQNLCPGAIDLAMMKNQQYLPEYRQSITINPSSFLQVCKVYYNPIMGFNVVKPTNQPSAYPTNHSSNCSSQYSFRLPCWSVFLDLPAP